MGESIMLGTVTQAAREIASLGKWDGARANFAPVAATGAQKISSNEFLLTSWRRLLDLGTMQKGEANLAGTARKAVVVISPKRAEALGVQIVDVRLKRIEFAPEISESVFRRMESERLRVANEARSIGAAESEKIRAEADRKREQIVAEAYGRAQAIMGEGDAVAAGIYAKAYGANLDFYSFYKSLEGYRAAFGKQGDVLVVDPTSDFFRYLKSAAGK